MYFLAETARQMKQSGHSHMEGAKQSSHNIGLEGGKSNSTPISDSQSQPCSSKQLTCESIKDSSVSNEGTTDCEESPATPPPETDSSPSLSSSVATPETPEKRGVKR